MKKIVYNVVFFSVIFYLMSNEFVNVEEPWRSVMIVAMAVCARGFDHCIGEWLNRLD